MYIGYKAISKENVELKNACLKVCPWDIDIKTSKEDKADYLEMRRKSIISPTENLKDVYEYNAYIRSILSYLFNTTD